MASAKRKTTETVVVNSTIVLELTEEEAAALRFVLGKIGGPPKGSLREHTESVNEALREIHVNWFDIEVDRTSNFGTLYFTRPLPDGWYKPGVLDDWMINDS